jgi:hypothetical protein
MTYRFHKNNKILEYISIGLTLGLHQIISYRFLTHTNNDTGKKSVFLNTASNNFLKETNYNYSCKSLN